MTNFEQRFLEHNGARIAFDICQSGETPPTHILLLINGFQRTRLDFRALRQKLLKLAPHVVTVALDNRFCGETVVEEEYLRNNSQDFSLDALAVLNECAQAFSLKQVSVLGISMGGMIAQECVHKNQSLHIENLFLVSTTVGGASRVWPKYTKNHLEYKERPKDLAKVQESLSRYFGEKFKKNSPLLIELFSKSMTKANQQANTDAQALKQFTFATGFDSTDWVRALNVKNVFIFTGSEDQVIPPENSFILHDKIPGSKLYIYEEIGHLILIEHPDIFVNDILKAFSPYLIK